MRPPAAACVDSSDTRTRALAVLRVPGTLPVACVCLHVMRLGKQANLKSTTRLDVLCHFSALPLNKIRCSRGRWCTWETEEDRERVEWPLSELNIELSLS